MNNNITFNYLDASALVKLLVKEEESDLLEEYVKKDGILLYTTSLCIGETLGVLKSMRFCRKAPIPSITEEQYLAASEYLLTMIDDNVIVVEEVNIGDLKIFSQVRSLVNKYKLDISDIFQIITIKEGSLSKASGLDSLLLITADGELAKAASSEGLRVWNCRVDPMPL